MLRKIITTILAVAILSVVPAMLVGCEQNTYTHSSATTEQNRVVDQNTVPE